MSIRCLVITLVAFASLSGCVLPPVGEAVVRCAVGDVCPDALRCVQGPAGGTCRPADAVCVVDVGGVPTEAANGTVCSGGICVAGACVAPVCGDHIISAGETCDGDVDGCREDCTRCGDGVIDAAAGEACDDGDDNSDEAAGACRTTCVAASCGDGVIDPGEACDAGARNSDLDAGACRTTCALAACGDGVVDGGEDCDDANVESGDGCRGDCGKVEACGDDIVDVGEACDDGNDNPRDGCRDCAETTWGIDVVVAGRTSGGETALTSPVGVDVDAVGGVYVADTGGHRVLRLDPSGAVEVIAGTGAAGFSGDGGPAIAAELRGPTDVAVSSTGQIFIADHLNDRVRVIDRGVVTTFAGGALGPKDDGDVLDGQPLLPATAARLRRPRALALETDRLLIAEEDGNRVRFVEFAGGGIGTVVGGGAAVIIPDGSDLRTGSVLRPTDIALSGGRLLIVEAGQQLLRSVAGGVITTVAGGGLVPPPAEGTAQAGSVGFDGLVGVAASGATVVLTDQTRREVYELRDNTIRTRVRSTATSSVFVRPAGVFVTASNALVVVDEGRHTCVQIAPNDEPDTILGTGLPGVTSEGALATTVTLVEPRSVVAGDGINDMLVADAGARRLFAVDGDGRLRTFAGTGDIGVPTTGPALGQPVTPLQVGRRADGTVVVIASAGELLGDVVLEYSPDGATVTRLPVTIPGPLELDAIPTDGTAPVAAFDFPRFAVQAHLVIQADRVIVGSRSNLFREEPTGEFSVFALEETILAMTLDDVDRLVILTSDGTVSEVTLGNPVVVTRIDTSEPQLPLLVHHDGRFLTGSQKQGIVDGLGAAGVPFLPIGEGRDGDGGRSQDASVASPAALVSEGPGRLLIVDRQARLVRRVTTSGGISTIDTVVGDLHPAGPGTLSAASLYAARTLALRAPNRLIVGGAAGRLLEVRLDTDPVVGTVAVVVGHPRPSENLNAPLARFVPLVQDAAAFFMSGRELTLLDGSRLLRVDTSAVDAATWSFRVTGTLDEIATSSAFIADAGPQIIVSDPTASCVRFFQPETGVVGPAVFGACGTAGAFAGLVRSPGPVVVADSGAIYLADTGNHRVLRRDPASGAVSVVIGDGSPSSAGQGGPAGIFPVNAPGQLAVDSAGNLFIASSTTVRLVANIDGDSDADADDNVSTIYGLGNREVFPESESRCIAALALDEDNNRLFVADACAGFIVQLDLKLKP